MENSKFSQELYEEVSYFLSELKDVMLSAVHISKIILDKAIEEWNGSQDFREEVMNNQSVLLVGSITGVGLGLLCLYKCCGRRTE